MNCGAGFRLRSDLESASKELFDLVLAGIVRRDINQRYLLKIAAQALNQFNILIEGRMPVC